MRIPFDLIAAVLFLEGIGRYLEITAPHGAATVGASTALCAWLGFLLVSWLLHELVTRHVEWRTRFGLYPAGFSTATGPVRHPLIAHIWGVRAAQTITVLLFAAILWLLRWPLWAGEWPRWLGMDGNARLGGLRLAESALVALPLNLTPFLLAMAAAWLPRRRLSSRLRGRNIPLWSYIAFEARLTWLPVALGAVLAAASDIAAIVPARYTAWLEAPGVDIFVLVAFVAFTSLIALPLTVIWLWQCRPLPDGELKRRLESLMARSGVKARDILIWGPRHSGLLNACVLGPWPRFRYVLISPELVDALGMQETEAVLAHELGHARYGHLSFLFVMILCLTALLDPLLHALPASWRASPLIEIGVIASFVTAYMYLFYGAIMRQCEREADLASAELLGTPAPLVAALEKLALITGNIRNVWCWHHGSIAERVAAVTRLSADPDGSSRLHARLRRVRILFAVLTAAALGAGLYARLC